MRERLVLFLISALFEMQPFVCVWVCVRGFMQNQFFVMIVEDRDVNGYLWVG